MNTREAVITLLQSRELVYSALMRCFADEPTEVLLNTLQSSEFEQICSILDDENESLSHGSAEIVSAISGIGFEGCYQEYAGYFQGMEMHVFPWESVYATGEKLIFQPCTLDVRYVYLAEGYKSSTQGQEPDDHIAIELDFMAKVAKRAAERYEHRDDYAAYRALETSEHFLEEHLSVLIDGLVESFESVKEESDFYTCVARFMRSYIKCDKALLVELRKQERIDKDLAAVYA